MTAQAHGERVPEVLERLVAPHVASFDWFLQEGLLLVVGSLRRMEVGGAGMERDPVLHVLACAAAGMTMVAECLHRQALLVRAVMCACSASMYSPCSCRLPLLLPPPLPPPGATAPPSPQLARHRPAVQPNVGTHNHFHNNSHTPRRSCTH